MVDAGQWKRKDVKEGGEEEGGEEEGEEEEGGEEEEDKVAEGRDPSTPKTASTGPQCRSPQTLH